MLTDINSILNSSLTFQSISDEKVDDILKSTRKPLEFRQEILKLKTDDSASGVIFDFIYNLEVNGASIALNYLSPISEAFECQYFDGFSSITYITSNPQNVTIEPTLIVESDNRLEMYPYNIASTEVVPVYSCPYSFCSLLLVETDPSKSSIKRVAPVRVKAYVFSSDLKNKLITTPLYLPNRKFKVCDGYIYNFL
jgi:hypothetical protein